MKTLARFSFATSIALVFLLTAATLLAYARSAATVPTVTSIHSRSAPTETVTLDDIDGGKPPLSVGSPVENVVFAADTPLDADRNITVDQVISPVIGATADPEQTPVQQDDTTNPFEIDGSSTTSAARQLAATDNDSKPLLSQGTAVDNVLFASQVPAKGSERAALLEQSSMGAAAANNAAADIDFWYGSAQKFGNIGQPQLEINVLGTVITPTGRISATYSLNGSAEKLLSNGPDKRRLARPGDFNVEIDYSDLISGVNTIVVTATDHMSITRSQTMTVNYTPGNSWPISYVANWAAAGGDIQNIAEVVDGQWALSGASVRPIVLDYDRLIAIGEVDWNDYEVVVPVTIHAIDEEGFRFPSNGPGVGLLIRWQGHYNEAGEQPDIGWKNLGALGWYRWSRATNASPILAGMQMLGYRGNEIDVNPTEVPTFETAYLMKMSVQSMIGKTAYYRFKSWPANQPEPAAWDMEASGLKDELTTGSLLLVAHHVDATFGNVTVRPLSAITSTIKTATDGKGTILLTPQKDGYSYGEEVEVIATGNGGFVLDNWGGDLSGKDTPLIIKVTQDMSITATFFEPTPSTVSASAQGNGSVKISPQKATYDYDELVTFTALAEPGFQFAGWSGSVTGTQNPVAVKVRQDMTVTATFEASAAPPVSDDFNTCKLDESLWTKVDPKGDSTITVNGQQLLISVPANVDHDLFTNKNFAPRILQPTPNTDFIVEAKFESALTSKFQTQGIIIEQDNDNLLRLEFYVDNNGVHIFAAIFEGGVAKTKANTIIAVPNGQPMFMRVTRVGESWKQEYSFDGVTWVENTTFTYALIVARSGVYGGNADPIAGDPDTSPAHTAIVDYFFNTASRIEPEDGAPLAPTVSIVGNGSVTKSPDKGNYTCAESIQLAATPDEGYQFDGWSGDITSMDNPLTITLSQGNDLTASFRKIGAVDSKIYLPIVIR